MTGISDMTIGIVLPYLKSRGTEKQALRLSKGLVAKGFRVVVFNVQGWGVPALYRSFADEGVKVLNLGTPLDEGVKRVSSWRLFSLVRQVRKTKCSVLISRSGLTNRLTGLVGLLLALPTVAILSSSVIRPDPSRSRFMSCLASLMMNCRSGFPSMFLSVSREGAQAFQVRYALLKERVLAIPNGIEEIENGLDTLSDPVQTAQICYVGSLEIYRKGMDVLIQAMTLLKQHLGMNDFRAVLIGSGEDEVVIRARVEESGLSMNVVFAGDVVPPYALMRSCRIFVLPSRREGMPNALLEAMRLGLCAIAADCDTGPREVITHGQNGLLFPVGDAEALSQALHAVLCDEDLCAHLAQAGQETVNREFSCVRMVNEYHALIQNLLNVKKGEGAG